MANSNVLIPQDAANILKCSFCNKYLSVPPVYTTDYALEKYKCGRCNLLGSDNVNTRAKMYEKLAQFMLFPCINDRCKEKLSWGTVLDHEKLCPFRTIICPSDDCDVPVEIEQIITHFNLYHLEYKKTDSLEVSDVSLKTENFTVFLLVKFKQRPFLFFQYTNDVFIWFSVFCFNQEDSNQTFEVKLASKKNSFTVCDQKIVLFNNGEHCINCILRLCEIRSHKYSKSNAPYRYSREISDAMMTTKLDNQTVKNILRSDWVDYIVNIKDDPEQPPKAKKQKIKTRSSRKEEEIKEKAETRENIDKVLMENIECPVCSSYMCSPIYLCQTGHSICERCLSRLQKCPFCQAKFVNSRNYALEKISEIFKITQPSRPKQKKNKKRERPVVEELVKIQEEMQVLVQRLKGCHEKRKTKILHLDTEVLGPSNEEIDLAVAM